MGSAYSPFHYFATCSEPGLESYELSRLNQASNLRKEFRHLIDQWIDCEAEARVARLMLESRRAEVSLQAPGLEPEASPQHPQQMTLPFPLLDTLSACVSSSHRTLPSTENRNELHPAHLAPTADAPACEALRTNVPVAAPLDRVPPSRPLARLAPPQLHNQRQARRNLEMFVRRQTVDGSQHRSARSQPAREDQGHGAPRALRALGTAAAYREFSGGRKSVSLALVRDDARRSTRSPRSSPRMDHRLQCRQSFSKSSAERSTGAVPQSFQQRALGTWPTLSNDRHDPQPSCCVVQ
ncbi:MAG TPA: hypothetical protein VEJ46_06715 [Candidatus Acidoferrum sp.]|nr:hypothetical protein [Candidatus Acidoferrum sp.]